MAAGDVLMFTGNGEAVSMPRAAGPEPTERAGGYSSATLNHLVGPSPIEEWVKLADEEARLIEKLHKVSDDKARLELHLRLAGLKEAELQQALRDRGIDA